MAYSAADVERNFRAGKVSCLIGIEGGHAIENSLGALRMFAALGVRYITLTHWRSLSWATASTDTARRGLSAFGREVVHEMNRLGILVDLSHVNDGTMSTPSPPPPPPSRFPTPPPPPLTTPRPTCPARSFD